MEPNIYFILASNAFVGFAFMTGLVIWKIYQKNKKSRYCDSQDQEINTQNK